MQLVKQPTHVLERTAAFRSIVVCRQARELPLEQHHVRLDRTHHRQQFLGTHDFASQAQLRLFVKQSPEG